MLGPVVQLQILLLVATMAPPENAKLSPVPGATTVQPVPPLEKSPLTICPDAWGANRQNRIMAGINTSQNLTFSNFIVANCCTL